MSGVGTRLQSSGGKHPYGAISTPSPPASCLLYVVCTPCKPFCFVLTLLLPLSLYSLDISDPFTSELSFLSTSLHRTVDKMQVLHICGYRDNHKHAVSAWIIVHILYQQPLGCISNSLVLFPSVNLLPSPLDPVAFSRIVFGQQ